jgi:beta-glucosidase
MKAAVVTALTSGLALLGAAGFANGRLAQRRLASHDTRADALLAKMTLDEKIGQMTQAEQDKLDLADIETYFLGSVLSGGNSDPAATNTFAEWREMYDRHQARAQKTRLGIPILYGVDALHGHNNVVGAVVFPHNIGLGATRNARLVEDIARATALEVRATGIQWAFAPCVAVPRDKRWGRTYEGYSEDPQLVAELGGAAVRGLQGDDPSDPRRVAACAKHFVGDGGSAWGTGVRDKKTGQRYPLDRGDTRLSEDELRRLHLPGYLTAIEAGVLTIMPSDSEWNGEKVGASKRLLTDMLKGELGFEGFLISDYNAIEELPGTYADQIRASVNAGMDMFMVPGRHREFFTTLKTLVQDGAVAPSRVDDAVRRILRVKAAMGLLDPARSFLADRSLEPVFGGADHRALARRAVRESLVLLKNDGNTLPLPRAARRIHVAGRSADDMGRQCGGWTISWQGQSGAVTQGVTVLGAIRNAASPDTKVTFSADGTGAEGADAAVVVVGEGPYAEFQGDREDISLEPTDVETIARVAKTGVPVAVVVVAGRPVVLNGALDHADALVVAWLPGSEGDGVADVLFGAHAPEGKLPVSWPRLPAQATLNVGDAAYDPLFPFGYGLTYPPESGTRRAETGPD